MVNKHTILLFSSIALCSLHDIYRLRPFVVDHDTLKYEFNTDILKTMTMQLFEYKNHNAFNATLTLREDLQQFNLVNWISATRSNGKPWTLFNVTLNGCQILENTLGKTNAVLGALIKEIKIYVPILPRKCPIKKNIEYSVVNLYVNEEMLPIYLPETDFRTFIGVITPKNIYALKIYLTGYVAAKSGQKYRNIQKSKQGKGNAA